MTAEEMLDGEAKPVTKDITVDIDDLCPCDRKVKAEKRNPLTLGYEPQHPRAADYDFKVYTKGFMAMALNTSVAQLASASAANVEEKIEVVYIPENAEKGEERGLGIYQCRVKQAITTGSLRLYPYGGTLLHWHDEDTRRGIQKSLSVKPCYIRCLQLSAQVSKGHRMQAEHFVLYTAISPKLAKKNLDDKIEVQHLPPFWALMLAKKSEQVNMKPYMETYRYNPPVPKYHGDAKQGGTMSLQVPFFTNTRDLKVGDLLIVPYDGGLQEIHADEFPGQSDEASFTDVTDNED